MRTARKRTRASSESIALPDSDQDAASSRTQREADVWDAFCEEYVESVEQLPLSVHRNFALLKEIDAQTNALGMSLLSRLKEYIYHRRAALDPTIHEDTLTKGRLASGKLLSDISLQINELFRNAEEKVFLAQATYDAVDRHVRLMDQALGEPGMQLNNDLSYKDDVESTAVVARADSQTRTDKVIRPRVSTRPRRIQNTRSATAANISVSNANGNDGTIVQTKAGEMPIDPNEPRYCYCGQVSWGKMIACDAAGCEREWFHLACVGLTEAPRKGKWYCNICKENNQAGIRRRG